MSRRSGARDRSARHPLLVVRPGAYGRNSYARAATSVDQIRRILGEETFWRAFRTWAERWRFDHPTTEDFLDAFRPAAGGKLEPLFRETWYGNGTTDYAVHPRLQHRGEAVRGVRRQGESASARRRRRPEENLHERMETKTRARYESIALVSRTGTIPLPVSVVLTFENGVTLEDDLGRGTAPWLRLRTTYGSRLAKAEVDPERKVVLDANPWNNARYTGKKQGPSAAAKVRAYALHGVQILLSSLWLLR